MDRTALVYRAQGGDAGAFSDLVHQYQTMVFGYALSMLGDTHLAQEVTQETLIVMYRNLPALRSASAFAGWLRGVARYQCYHALRRCRLPSAPLEHAAIVADPDADPATVIEVEDLRARVWNAVMALPRAQRDVVILYYLQERSHRQVAASLGIPATTVNNRLHAARKTLVGYLSAYADDDSQRAPGLDFDEVLGRIHRVDGSLLEARFRNGTQPALLNSVATPNHAPLAPAAFVSQHLPDGSVRCVSLAATGSMRAGTGIVDTREPTELAVESPLLERVLRGVTRRPPMPPTIVETGIKVIDLLCPIVRGGRVGVFGPVGAGKLVIAAELIYRLSTVIPSISLLYFVQPGTELAHLHALPDPLPSAPAPMQTIYLPIENPADLSALTSLAAAKSLETTLYMSRDLVTRQLYPAVDTLLSASHALDPMIVGQEHYDVSWEVRRAIRRAGEVKEAVTRGIEVGVEGRIIAEQGCRLQSFLTQDLYTTQHYTKRPGQFVPVRDTVAACRALLAR